MLDSAFERWMNTPANPAVTSSEAGISAISSRLRALMVRSPPRGFQPRDPMVSGFVRPPLAARPSRSLGSLRNPSQLEAPDQAHRARLRAKLVVEEVRAAVGRH